MINVFKNNSLIAVCENPNWIRLLDNGCYGLCDKDAAQGIAVSNIIYNLSGHDIGADETVVCVEVDGGEFITRQKFSIDSINADTESIMLAVTETYEKILAQNAENEMIMLAITELYENLLGGK